MLLISRGTIDSLTLVIDNPAMLPTLACQYLNVLQNQNIGWRHCLMRACHWCLVVTITCTGFCCCTVGWCVVCTVAHISWLLRSLMLYSCSFSLFAAHSVAIQLLIYLVIDVNSPRKLTKIIDLYFHMSEILTYDFFGWNTIFKFKLYLIIN